MSTITNIQHIGELSKDGVFVYDLTTRKFTYINDPFAAFFTYGKEKLLGWPELVLAFIHLEDNNYLLNRYNELLKEKSFSGIEFRLQFPNGEGSHISCDAYFLEETNQVAGFLRDITKEKQHEDYIINYGAKKDTLLDMMSHNLAGPLLLSQDMLNWVQKDYGKKNTEPVDELLKMIQENTQHCIDIVDDFLKEEHLESENIFVKKTRFDLLARINATLDKLMATNRNKKFRLVTSLENLNITTDSVKFFQIVHNLISNSIKFTPENGEIDIVVEETGESFIIRVADNGIGIPTNLHGSIFKKRTPAGRKGLNNEKSSGIGLSIVKTLVELLGGKLSFTSTENQGSVFSFELPKE